MKQVNEVTGKTEEIFAKPIHSQDAELVRQRLLEYGNIEIIGLGYDNGTYHVDVASEYFTEGMRQAMETSAEASIELNVDLIVLDQTSYEKLCNVAKVPVGSNILLNYYRYNNDGRLQHIVPFSEEMTEIVLKKANGDNNGSSAEYCYCDGRDYHLWICRSVITDWSS